MQRITKDPEIRRQEIIDTAMQLFTEKGYEQTSMLDITKKLNVSQGLCYRYFKSKEEIYQAALENYVNQGIEAFMNLFGDNTQSLIMRLDNLQPLNEVSQDDNVYGEFVNQPQNSIFHAQMQLVLCDRLIPVMADMLQQANENGEINIDNPISTASFCVFGQLGIWLNTRIPIQDKITQTKTLIKKALGK